MQDASVSVSVFHQLQNCYVTMNALCFILLFSFHFPWSRKNQLLLYSESTELNWIRVVVLAVINFRWTCAAKGPKFQCTLYFYVHVSWSSSSAQVMLCCCVLCVTCVRELECYFLGVHLVTRRNTHLQPIHNGKSNNNNQSSRSHSSSSNSSVYRSFGNAEKVFRWNCWILRDITHLRSGHYTSLTQCKTHTRTQT